LIEEVIEHSKLLDIHTEKDRQTAEVDVIEGHDICSNDRKRMIDWMIQVFRVLKVSSPGSIFTATSIMDRYFVFKNN
jgi:hypothetical protein